MTITEAVQAARNGRIIQNTASKVRWCYSRDQWWSILQTESSWRPEDVEPTVGDFEIFTGEFYAQFPTVSPPPPTPPMQGTNPRAMRDNDAKPRLAQLLQFAPALEGVARNCDYGASKYDRYNNQIGLPTTELLDACLRHMSSFFNGEDTVPDAAAAGYDVHHIDAAIWNLLQLRTQIAKGQDQHDDRP